MLKQRLIEEENGKLEVAELSAKLNNFSYDSYLWSCYWSKNCFVM